MSGGISYVWAQAGLEPRLHAIDVSQAGTGQEALCGYAPERGEWRTGHEFALDVRGFVEEWKANDLPEDVDLAEQFAKEMPTAKCRACARLLRQDGTAH